MRCRNGVRGRKPALASSAHRVGNPLRGGRSGREGDNRWGLEKAWREVGAGAHRAVALILIMMVWEYMDFVLSSPLLCSYIESHQNVPKKALDCSSSRSATIDWAVSFFFSFFFGAYQKASQLIDSQTESESGLPTDAKNRTREPTVHSDNDNADRSKKLARRQWWANLTCASRCPCPL